MTRYSPRCSTPVEAQARAAWLVDQMRTHFADALVPGRWGLEGPCGLPDPDDEHVLAAAVVAGTGAIVTDNRRDVPVAKVPEGIEILAPQVFACTSVSLDPRRAMAAVDEFAARSGRRMHA